MKLEVGQYVRTRCSGILPLLSEDKEHYYFGKNRNNIKYCCLKEDLERSLVIGYEPSYNIIDLIEAGDYVNNSVVVKDSNEKLFVHNTGLIYDNNMYIPLENITIRSIVTKEQFEAMQYVI